MLRRWRDFTFVMGVGLTLAFPAGGADLRLEPPTGLEKAVVVKKPEKANVASATKVFMPRRPFKVASEQQEFAGSRDVVLFMGVGF
jgi:hypothetical protein